jgi:hypothetical protein
VTALASRILALIVARNHGQFGADVEHAAHSTAHEKVHRLKSCGINPIRVNCRRIVVSAHHSAVIRGEDTMWDIFRSDPEKLSSVLFWVIVVVGILGYAGIKAWRKNEAGKRDAELKLEMIAKGMSATDIERVLAANTGDSRTAETTYHKQ